MVSGQEENILGASSAIEMTTCSQANSVLSGVGRVIVRITSKSANQYDTYIFEEDQWHCRLK